jgi:hypothetical protein
LSNNFPVLLEHEPLHQRKNACFIRDGAPPYLLRIVRQHLNHLLFGEQWIGRGCLANWPVWSPYLNPLDFWLWRHLKTLVYSAPINDLEVLQLPIENASQGIWVKPGIFDRVRLSVQRRAESCVEMHGNHIEHHMNIAYISADTGFWTYVAWDICVYLSEYYTPLKTVTIFNTLYTRKYFDVEYRSQCLLRDLHPFAPPPARIRICGFGNIIFLHMPVRMDVSRANVWTVRRILIMNHCSKLSEIWHGNI